MIARFKITTANGQVFEHEEENKWPPYTIIFGIENALRKITEAEDAAIESDVYEGFEVAKIEVISE